MKLGYSMTLGEILEAEEIEPGDCGTFLVVCPACREAVFKKTLTHASGVTHYLSHHLATDEESRQCELRVAAMSKERVSQFNAESRGQTLNRFMVVLQSEINRSQDRIFVSRHFAEEVQKLKARKTFEDVLPLLKKGFNVVLADNNPRDLIVSMISEFDDFNDRSPFWMRRQASHVLDVMMHLNTAQQEPNLRHLLAAVVVQMVFRMEGYVARSKSIGIPGYDLMPALRILEGMVAGKSREGMKKLTASLLSVQGKAPTKEILEERFLNLQRGIIAECIGPIVGVLTSIPFTDIALGRRGNEEKSNEIMAKMFKDMLEVFRSLEQMKSAPAPEESTSDPKPGV